MFKYENGILKLRNLRFVKKDLDKIIPLLEVHGGLTLGKISKKINAPKNELKITLNAGVKAKIFKLKSGRYYLIYGNKNHLRRLNASENISPMH